MLGFGESVYLWRITRGLTQSALAQQAGLPRPALSALERGVVDPTLRTIRRLAKGLGVRSGILVDGELPGVVTPRRLSRAALERITASLVGGPAPRNLFERQVVVSFRELLRNRVAIATGRPLRRGSARRERQSWVWLQQALTPAERASIMSRLEKQGPGDRQAA